MILPAVKIEKAIFKGFGLGSYKNKKVLVPLSYPGDVVDVQVISEKKDYYKGLPAKIITSGYKRIETNCPAFQDCGGCNSLNISYPDQLEIKKQVMQDIFPNYLNLVQETVASPQIFHYRNKVFFPVYQSGSRIKYGMFKNHSHQIISANQCRLVSPLLLEIAQSLCDQLSLVKESAYNERTGKGNIRHIGMRINKQEEVMLIIVTNKSKLAFSKKLVEVLTKKHPQIISIIQNINNKKGNKILGETDKILYGNSYFYDKIADKTFKINYQSFFQVNHPMTQIIYKQIKNDLPINSNLLDAYSGVSTIGIYVESKVKKVISVESNSWATQDAEYNLKLNKCHNLLVINDKLEDIFYNLINDYKIDTIVFDPPRKGLESNIRQLIMNSSIKRIIYLSCNPTSQKRDIQDLLNAGFIIQKIIPFDMFPQTYHIESYALLTR